MLKTLVDTSRDYVKRNAWIDMHSCILERLSLVSASFSVASVRLLLSVVCCVLYVVQCVVSMMWSLRQAACKASQLLCSSCYAFSHGSDACSESEL